jgi:hypothetical protein
MPRLLAWALVGPLTLIASFAFSLFELIFLAVFFLLPSADRVHRSWPLSLRSIHALYTTLAKATLVDFHDLIEIAFFHIVSFLFDALLELGDHLNIFFFLLMFVLHLEVLQRLMEFLVFSAKFFLFKSLDLDLLLQQATFNLDHMLVIFKHLRKKIVWSSNRNVCL